MGQLTDNGLNPRNPDNYVMCVGIKSLLSMPMTRGQYNDYRGWATPKEENPDDEGYLVEYQDGGKPNDARHLGYISWSPKDVFEKSYKPNGNLGFSEALVALKEGKKVARLGWNGKDQYVVAQGESKQIEAAYIWNPHNKAHAEKIGGYIDVAAYCTLKTAQDTLAMGWVPSTGDLFANDWSIVG